MPPPVPFDMEPILAGMKALREGLAERVLPRIEDPAMRAEIQQMVAKIAEYQTQVPAEYEQVMAVSQARIEKSVNRAKAMIDKAEKALQAPPPLPAMPVPPAAEAPAPAYPTDYGQQLRGELLNRYRLSNAPAEAAADLDDSVWHMGAAAWQEAPEPSPPPRSAPPPPRPIPEPKPDAVKPDHYDEDNSEFDKW